MTPLKHHHREPRWKRPQQAHRISLAMIVKDEESFLPGCLESVKGLVDEMVIVDTGSQDASPRIAESHGARVIHQEWTGDFSEARNAGLAECTGEWALYLDADERLHPTTAEALRTLCAGSAAAYYVGVRSVLSLERETATQMMQYPRLFRRLPGVRFEGAVHEQIIPSILRAGGTVRPSSLVIEHLGYNQGYEVLRAKVHRNLGPLLDRVEENGGDWYSHLQLARSFLLLQDHPAVTHHARAALGILGTPRPIAALLYNILAEVAFKSKQHGEAVDLARKSLLLLPSQVGARWFLSLALAASNAPRVAITTLEEMLTVMAKPTEAMEDVVIPLPMALELLGRCYLAIGSVDKAAEVFFRAVRDGGASSGLVARYLDAQEKLGNSAVAVRQGAQLLTVYKDDLRLRLFLAVNLKKAGHVDRAKPLLEEVLEREPGHSLALTWKGLWLLEAQDFPGVEAVLSQANAHGVASEGLTRCAFELALAQSRFGDALTLLSSMAVSMPREQFEGLRKRIELLASAAG